MKKKKMIPIYCVLVLGIFSLIGCGGDMLTAPGAENENQNVAAEQRGIPDDQINLLSFKSEIVHQLRALGKDDDEHSRDGYEEKLIKAKKGGSVGGKETFGNKVKFPEKSLSKDTWISVRVECRDSGGQCGGTVEFLPSMHFLRDVKVTLSYDVLNFNGDPNLLKVVWYDEATGLWVEVENPKIDEEHKTVSVKVNHFTRYAWSL